MKAGITLLLIFFFSLTFGQVPTYSNVAVPSRPSAPMFLRDLFSAPFEPKPYAGIQGSPYIEDGWTLARIRFQDTKRTLDSIRIKLNVYEDKIHYKDENGVEMQMTMRAEEIRIIDSNSALNGKVYLSGFDQGSGFFEVLAEAGNLRLLKRYRAFVWETKPLGSEPQKNFDQETELYLCRDYSLFKANKNCLSTKEAVGNNEKMLNYISSGNIRCNKEEDLRKLISFYASSKDR